MMDSAIHNKPIEKYAQPTNIYSGELADYKLTYKDRVGNICGIGSDKPSLLVELRLSTARPAA